MIHDHIYRYVCILNISKTRDSIANDSVFTRLASLRVGFGHKRYSLWTMGIKIWIPYFHMKSLFQLIYQPVFFIHRHCFCWHCTKKWGTDCSHSAWGSGMNRGIYLLEIDLLFSEKHILLKCALHCESRIHCKIILIWWMFQISISEFVWGATRRHVCVVRISTDCLGILRNRGFQAGFHPYPIYIYILYYTYT